MKYLGPTAPMLLRSPPISSSSAVAERQWNASCLAVISVNTTKRGVQSSVISKLASDLLLHTIKFTSVLFSSSWSLMLAVINKIHQCMAVCAVNCTVNRRNYRLHSSTHRSDSQTFAENHNFAYLTCIRCPH